MFNDFLRGHYSHKEWGPVAGVRNDKQLRLRMLLFRSSANLSRSSWGGKFRPILEVPRLIDRLLADTGEVRFFSEVLNRGRSAAT